MIANLGSFDEPPEADVFLGEPAVEHDARRNILRKGYRLVASRRVP